MPIENIWALKSVFANCHIVSTVRKQFYSHNHLFPVSELLPNALKSQCIPSSQTYAFFSKPFDLKAFLYFAARSYVLASAVARSQSNFYLLVFLGVPCVGDTSTFTRYGVVRAFCYGFSGSLSPIATSPRSLLLDSCRVGSTSF